MKRCLIRSALFPTFNSFQFQKISEIHPVCHSTCHSIVTVSLRFAWPFSPFPLPLEFRFAGFVSFLSAGTLVELRRAGVGVERPLPGCGVTWPTRGPCVAHWEKRVLTAEVLMDHCGWIIVDRSLRSIRLVENHKYGECMRM